MSNPDFPPSYWPDPAGVGGNGGTRRGSAATDPYVGQAGYGRPAGYDGYGRPAGSERPARNGRGQGRAAGNGSAGNGAARGGSARDGGQASTSAGPSDGRDGWYRGDPAQDRGEPSAQPGRRAAREPRGRSARGRSASGRSARDRAVPVGGAVPPGPGVPVPPSRGVPVPPGRGVPAGRGVPPGRGVPVGRNASAGRDRGARVGQDPRASADGRSGSDAAYLQGPPAEGSAGRVAQDLRARLGMRTGAASRTAHDRSTRRGLRPVAAGPAGLAGASGYPGTLERGGPGGPPGGYQPQDGRNGRTRGHAGTGDGGRRGGSRGGGPGNRGRGFRQWLRSGSWWRRWTWRKALALVAGAFTAMMLVVAAGVVYAYSKTVVPTAVSEVALQQSSSVYFSNGKSRVGSFSSSGIHRQLLTSAQIPKVLRYAVLAAEDRHFYTEGGVSLTGIVRAAYQDLTGGTFQGASTITQQFVRNYYTTIGTGQTVSRKMKEILVAIKLSHSESKDWILTNYLNTVYLGDTAYGAGAAAQIYFNRQASQLSVAQAAMLAAMINEPGYFNPDPTAGAAYQALVARWHYVLDGMVKDGNLSQALAAAQTFPKIVHGQSINGSTGYRGYIMTAVQNELESRYGYTLQQIESDGLKIVTTFNEPMMNTLYRTVAQAKRQMAQFGQRLPYWAHVGVVLEKPGTGAIEAMYGGPGTTVPHCFKLKCQLNMALQSRNQVGSSFKPYVLATAVHMNMNAQTSVLDGYPSICSPSDAFPGVLSLTIGGTTCPPSQYGYYNFNSFGESNGPVTVAKASALSLNTAYGDLIHRVGTQNVINMAQAFGVNTGAYTAGGSNLQAMKGQSGIALGQGSLTVEEQATTFATLADGGMYHTPHVIAKITQASGASVPLKVQHRRVLTPAEAADVDWALSFDTIYGTGFPNAVLNPVRPTIAKTGTTDFAQDAFFIGAIPQYSLAVGMFTNNQTQKQYAKQTLNVLPSINGQAGGFGGAWPATIWRLYMTNEFSRLPVLPLATPDFTGFDKWVQVPPKPKRHKHPNPGPSCGPQRGRGQGPGAPCPTTSPSPPCTVTPQQPCPTSTPTPTPNPTPTPTPTCTPSPTTPCPPPSLPPGGGGQGNLRPAGGGQGNLRRAAAIAQPADDPAVVLARLRLPGG